MANDSAAHRQHTDSSQGPFTSHVSSDSAGQWNLASWVRWVIAMWTLL